MQNLLRNLRFSSRMLLKNPGLTLTILLTLALGVGANTAIFTVDYATLLEPLPYPHPEQLVVVWSKIQGFHCGVPMFIVPRQRRDTFRPERPRLTYSMLLGLLAYALAHACLTQERQAI